MKRVISILMVVLLMFSSICVAFADVESRASQVIDSTTVGISFNGGKVYGMGNIRTVATADKLGMSAMALYVKEGSSWTRVASASSKYGYNDDSYTHTISATAVDGADYKMVCTFYGKIGSLTDSLTQTKYS